LFLLGAAAPAAQRPDWLTTIAGTNKHKFNGDNRRATTATLFQPQDVAIDRRGNVYIADTNSRVRKINRKGIITTVAGCGPCPGTRATGRETRGRATRLVIYPTALAFDRQGSLYVGTPSQIWKVRRGRATLIAGHRLKLTGYTGDGGPARGARLHITRGIAFDSRGNLLFSDSSNHVVRRITPRGRITTIAGTGESGYSGDGGPATAAQLSWPKGVAVDRADNIYVADDLNNRVRRIAPDGTISTFAGNGGDYTPDATVYDGGPATAGPTTINPDGLEVDRHGNVFIATSRRVAVVDGTGTIRTALGYDANLEMIQGIAVDRSGNLYVTAPLDDRVYKVAAPLG
jgi:sugar lactone lactonase YvrE